MGSSVVSDTMPESTQGAATVPKCRVVHCCDCGFYRVCFPAGHEEPLAQQVAALMRHRQPVGRQQVLFGVGEPFRALYAVRSGAIKAYGRNGALVGIYLPGEVVGAEGMATGHYGYSARAAQALTVCELPVAELAQLGAREPVLLQAMAALMSRELTAARQRTLVLNAKAPGARLARLLLQLASRLRAGRFPAMEYELRLTRAELGSYLGLATETVCRLLVWLRREGVVDASGRRLRLLDPVALSRLAAG
jgi:CRP/FNR family transcriptional regulator